MGEGEPEGGRDEGSRQRGTEDPAASPGPGGHGLLRGAGAGARPAGNGLPRQRHAGSGRPGVGSHQIWPVTVSSGRW